MPGNWLFVLFVLSLAGPAMSHTTLWDDIRVKHMWNATPANWESLGHPPAGNMIDLHIALKPHRKNALVDALYEVSTPKHPKYGAHLSKVQVAELVAPHPDTLELVNSWLEHHGISSSSVSRTHGGGWLTITDVPVPQADALLGASYQLYRHTGTNGTEVILRTVGYALPAELHAHVRTVVPTTYFGSLRMPQQTQHKGSREFVATENATSGEPATVLSSRDEKEPEYITPSILRWLYNTAGYVPRAKNRNFLGIVGFLGMYPSPADLRSFVDLLRQDARPAHFSVKKINGGGFDPRLPNIEPNSNVQIPTGIAYPTPLVFYSVGGVRTLGPNDEAEKGDPWLTWLRYMIDLEKVPQTINISYGIEELDIPFEYADGLCDLFSLLGARGVSILASSGNDGVGSGDCKDESGEVVFTIAFPASCPYVTSVGGTTGGTTGLDPEVAVDFSQGGFSIFFERHDYQDDAVNAYLKHLGNKYSGLFNPEGRAVPDISAQAFNYLLYNASVAYLIHGTSCAAPTASAIISLLNDYQISEGRPPLGWLNPWLYGEGYLGFNDITKGSNPGCGTEGFDAITGWDPVTGFGTPDFLTLQLLLD